MKDSLLIRLAKESLNKHGDLVSAFTALPPLEKSMAWLREEEDWQLAFWSKWLSWDHHQYQWKSMIGQGGRAQIFEAVDPELDRVVAIKQIRPEIAANAIARDKFLQEIHTTAKLKHPAIAPVYSMGESQKGLPYFAMLRIDGETLHDRLLWLHGKSEKNCPADQCGLEFRKLLVRFRNICEALAYLHSKNVHHRDLSPRNIMLSEFDVNYIIDFGARRGSSQDKLSDDDDLCVTPKGDVTLGGSVTTPEYNLTPEMLADKPIRVDAARDIYALGAIFYHLLTGQAPFNRKDQDHRDKIKKGEFLAPRKCKSVVPIPKGLEYICLKAMSLRFEDRYDNPAKIAEQLDRWMADLPVEGCVDSWPTRLARVARRHRNWFISGAICGLLAVVALTIAFAVTRLALTRAEQAEQLARNAVEEYYINISEDVLLNTPRMQGLRQRLLRVAKDYHEKIASDFGGSRDDRFQLARTLDRLARIEQSLSRDPLAYERQALRILEELRVSYPNDRLICFELVKVRNNLGNFLYARDQQSKEAQIQWEKALEEVEFALEPYSWDVKADLCGHFGMKAQNSKQFSDAVSWFEREIQARDQSINAKVKNPERFVEQERLSTQQRKRIQGKLRLIELKRILKTPLDEIREQLVEARTEADAMLNAKPNADLQTRAVYVQCLIRWASFLKQLPQKDEFPQAVDLAVKEASSLADENPIWFQSQRLKLDALELAGKNMEFMASYKKMVTYGHFTQNKFCTDLQNRATTVFMEWLGPQRQWRKDKKPGFPPTNASLLQESADLFEMTIAEWNLAKPTPEAQEGLAKTQIFSALVLVELGRGLEGENLIAQAVNSKTVNEETRREARVFQSWVWARIGKFDQAQKAVENLEPQCRKSPDLLVTLAGTLARCSSPAENNKNLNEAIRLLSLARQEYEQSQTFDMNDWEDQLCDPDFDSLRTLPKFENLLGSQTNPPELK